MTKFQMCLLAGLLSGAAAAPAAEADGTAKLQAFLTQCRAKFGEVDARIDKSGMRDAGYHRVPGFPYLRSDRLMASFNRELAEPAAFDDWTLQLRDNDAYSREIEFSNMGLTTAERAQLLVDLRLCAVWLTNTELGDPVTLKRLRRAMQVPGDATPRSDADGAAWRARVHADFAAPLSAESTMLWQAGAPTDPRVVAQGFSGALHDHLGRAGLLMGEWPILAARYAPKLWIETHGDYDRPGAPVWQSSDAPGIDIATPVVYYLPSYARVKGRVLVQLNYFIWFSGRGEADAHMDGLIWRVTLDEGGQALMYDSIHTSGFDQLWFPLAGWAPRAAVPGQESVLAPQAAIPAGEVAVRLRSGSHDVQRLVAPDAATAAPAGSFELRPYEDLLTLKRADGGSRSLFDAHGRVSGSADLRQWGRHPVTPLAQRYFDDPALIEALFVVPSAVSGHAATTR